MGSEETIFYNLSAMDVLARLLTVKDRPGIPVGPGGPALLLNFRGWFFKRLAPAALAALPQLMGLALRTRLWRGSEPLLVERSATYLDPARHFLETGKLNHPELLRRHPIYPLFLALSTAPDGTHPRKARIAQHFASASAAAASLCRPEFSLWAGAVSAGLLAGRNPDSGLKRKVAGFAMTAFGLVFLSLCPL